MLDDPQRSCAVQASIARYLQLCDALKDFRPDVLRQLELLDLDTCLPPSGKEAADQKPKWMKIFVSTKLR